MRFSSFFSNIYLHVYSAHVNLCVCALDRYIVLSIKYNTFSTICNCAKSLNYASKLHIRPRTVSFCPLQLNSFFFLCSRVSFQITINLHFHEPESFETLASSGYHDFHASSAINILSNLLQLLEGKTTFQAIFSNRSFNQFFLISFL